MGKGSRGGTLFLICNDDNKVTYPKTMLKQSKKTIGLPMSKYIEAHALAEEYSDDDRVFANTDTELEGDFVRNVLLKLSFKLALRLRLLVRLGSELLEFLAEFFVFDCEIAELLCLLGCFV